jgi:hypothetical protein
MGIDARDFEAIKSFVRPWSGKGHDCMILGDCTFHVPGLTLQHFANACGFRQAHTIDIVGDPTHKFDLTELPWDLQRRYAVVIDAGTLYWCMDIMAAWRGALSLLKDGGGIFHSAGLSGYFGRAYYSVHPKLFRDFYRSQNFEITRMAVRPTRATDDRMIEMRPDDIYSSNADMQSIKFGPEFVQHIIGMPADMQIICTARQSPNAIA